MALANRAGMMVSPAAAKAGLLDAGPVGIGPYTAGSIEAGNKVEFEKTPNYWDPDVQRVATMTYYYIPDDQTRMNALKSGELDGTTIPATELDLMADSGFHSDRPAELVAAVLRGEHLVRAFDDPEVRKAINMSINREEISQGLYDGYCTAQIQPFPKSSPGYSDKIGDGPDVINSRYIAATSLFNPGNTDYPKLTEYGNEGASSADPADRKPAYEKYMDAWVETPPHVIPVCMVEGNSIYAENVSGVTQRANGYVSLRGVAVAKE